MTPIFKQIAFPPEQYMQERTVKQQICLHHTASGKGAEGDFKWWMMNTERVATPVIIDYNGVVDQLFDEGYWAHHLGTHAVNNKRLNQACIGIEIDSWGPLYEYNGKYFSYLGAQVAANEVQAYPQGFKAYPKSEYFDRMGCTGHPALFYQKYSQAQIESVKYLLNLWCATYKISSHYNEDMWKLSSKALFGLPGIWTHVSYREDKADCHPQPEMIAMLKSLNP